MNNRIKRALISESKGVAFVLPALLFLAVFCIYPMCFAVRTSFFSWNMTSSMKFVGFRNYQKFFSSKAAISALTTTFKYVLYILPSSLILGFLLALLVHKPSKVNTLARTFIFIPHIASIVASCTIWIFLMNPQYGIINKILNVFGLPSVRWLNDVKTAIISVAFVSVWRQVGYNMIIFIGAIQNVQGEIIEAATIDGATRSQIVRRMIIPLVIPTAFMLMILNTISIFKMFTAIESLTEGGPAGSTTNLVYLIQKTAFNDYSLGYAFAMSVVLFLIILIVNILQMSLEKKVNYDV